MATNAVGHPFLVLPRPSAVFPKNAAEDPCGKQSSVDVDLGGTKITVNYFVARSDKPKAKQPVYTLVRIGGWNEDIVLAAETAKRYLAAFGERTEPLTVFEYVQLSIYDCTVGGAQWLPSKVSDYASVFFAAIGAITPRVDALCLANDAWCILHDHSRWRHRFPTIVLQTPTDNRKLPPFWKHNAFAQVRGYARDTIQGTNRVVVLQPNPPAIAEGISRIEWKEDSTEASVLRETVFNNDEDYVVL